MSFLFMNIPAVCWYDWINLMVVYCLSLWLNFSDEYVICNGCKSPDTILSKENRLFFLRCEQVKYLAKPCRMWGLQFCCDRFPTALGTFRYSRFLTLSMTVFCYTLVIEAIYPIIRVFFCQWWVATLRFRVVDESLIRSASSEANNSTIHSMHYLLSMLPSHILLL